MNQEFNLTLLKLPIMIDTATGSSTKAWLIILPIPSPHGISFMIFKVIGLIEISENDDRKYLTVDKS
jgi:hypothetical protein